MKRTLSVILVFCALICAFSVEIAGAESEKSRVVAAIFPIYDWVRAVSRDADGIELSLLLDSGVDLHSFQPTAEDILNVASCDLFIYVGGESDEWVEDVLREAVNPDMRVINLMDALGDDLKEEETVEGMEIEEEEEDGDEIEYDEHVWLSLRNAETLTRVIADALADIDPENAEAYGKNADEYVVALDALDSAYADAVASADCDTILFGDRFPFRYLADDYALNYYAAFSGCSAESEASFQTIAFLSDKVDALDLPAVLTIEGNNNRIAETIISNAAKEDVEVLTMDSMQATTLEDALNGVTYLGVMEQNLETLKRALTRR